MPHNLPPERDEDDIADARALFGDKTHEPPKKPPAPRPVVHHGDEYEIGGTAPPPKTPREPRSEAPPRDSARMKKPSRPEPSVDREANVEEVWSRGAEWGSDLAKIGAAAIGLLVLVYFVGSGVGLGPAFFLLMLGLAGIVAMSYPIAVTLERPLRMTPEQAAKDFYGAASHHFPHYRRMWLLLSGDGKESDEFDSFATFRTYWKHRIAKLRGSEVKGSTPLSFVVEDFRADKSAGQTVVESTYSVKVAARGEENDPLQVVPMQVGFSKGPDGMWYLDSGTMPDARRS